MDWSYELLTTDERRVLQRLSVFAAGCTLDAAEAVAAGEGIDRLDVLDHLAALVRRSLLIAGYVGDQTRYRSLEPIRQYAHERLEKSDDAHVVGRRHAEYYTRLALDAGPHLRGADQLAWIARLDPEIANLRAALLWALGQRDFDLALPLVVSVGVNDIAIGYHALAWAERVAAEPEIDEHPLGPVLLAHAVWSAVMTGRIDDAARYETRRVAAEAALGLAPIPATFLAPATIALFSGDTAAAADTARTWIDVARQSGDLYQTGQGLTMLGASLQSRGDPEGAHEVLQESVAHGRRLANPSNLSWALAWLGVNLLFLHRHEEAVRAMEETIAVGTEVGNRQAVAFARADLGFARAAAGDLHGALAAYVEAATEQVELSVANPVRVTFVRAADALAALGEQEASVVLYGAGTALQRRYRMGDEERELHDRLVETALHVLGQARFAELYDRGASMTPDDALDFARETIARLVNDS
jgi:hypothetical protein